MKSFKKLLAIVLCFSVLMSTMTVNVLAETTVTYGYDNLNNEEGNLNIAFIGGSITIGSSLTERYATHVTNWFQEKYPNKTVNQINAGMGGTPSEMGKYRIVSDICAHEPDVVFIEFAVNDQGYAAGNMSGVKQNMETMVRRLLSLPKQPVIVFLYSMDKDVDNQQKLYSIPAHHEVAQYYNIGEINFFDYMWEKVNDGTYIWHDKGASGTQLSDDGTHPNFVGHKIYGNYIISQLENTNVLHKASFVNAPMCKTTITQTNARDILAADGSIVKSGSWIDAQSTDGHYYPGIRATTADDYVSYTFSDADSIGFMHMGGTAEWIIDEGSENELTGTLDAPSSNSFPHYVICASYPKLSNGEHTLKIKNSGTDEKTNLRFMRILISDGANTVVAATDENGDHLPGSIPKNLLKDDNNAGAFSGRNSSSVDSLWHEQPRIWKWYANSTFGYNASWPAQGTYSNQDSMFAKTGAIEGNTTYVFSALLKDNGTNADGSSKITLGYVGNSRITSNEYGTSGYAPGRDWARFATTITTDSKSDGAFMLGFPTATEGDSVLMNLSEGAYFGKEEAYDITNTAVTKSIVAKGKSREYTAEVVNQMGIKGTLPQNFTWSVTDANGGSADTISLTPSENTSTVTVSTDDTTPAGTYLIKAYSTDYNWQKTARLTVVENLVEYDDYVAHEGKKPANMVVNPSDANAFSNSNGTSDSSSTSTTFTWIEMATEASSYWGAGKTLLTVDKNYITKGLTSGTSYVVSAKLRNDTPATRPSLVFGLSYSTGVTPTTIEVTNTDFETKAAAFTAIKDATSISLGLATTIDRSNLTDLGKLTMDISNGGSLYIAEEVAYDITNTITGSTRIIAGGSTKVKAEILNQVGIKGNTNQNISFVALNEERTEEVDGFIFTANADGTTTVDVSDTVAEGKYVILAVSDTYANMRKGATIEVIDACAFADSIPVMPGNMIANPANLNDLVKINGAGGSYINNWSATGSTNDFLWEEAAREVNAYWRVGPNIQNTSYAFQKGESYVVSVRLKNNTPDIGYTPSFGISNSWELVYSKPISNTEYQTITDTFTATQDTNSICLGFDATSSCAGGAIISMDISNGGSLYIAKEEAYDIVNTATGEKQIFAGNSTTISSKVVNQIGMEDNMLQNFSYTVLNSDRTDYADGITVTGDANGNATVNVGEEVQSGDYVILVRSDDYEGMQKGITITVIGKNTFADYIPDESKKPANIVADPDNVNALVSSNGAASNYTYENGKFFSWVEKTVGASTYWGAGFTYLTVAKGHLTKGLSAGTDYVVSARLKNSAPDVRADIDFALSYSTNVTPLKIAVSNTDYETKSAVFTASKDTENINLGLDATIDRSSYTDFGQLTMDLSNGGSLYIAEEVAYDIALSAPNGTSADVGESLTVNAEALNQVGLKGNIKQNFSWFALNEDRCTIADSITITDNGNGNATVSVDNNAKAGKYVIFAMSNDYSELKKGITITIADNTQKVTALSLTQNGGKAFLNATVSNVTAPQIMFVISSYTDVNGIPKISNATSKRVTPTDGIAEVSDLSIDVASGEKVKVFVWTNLLTPVKIASEFVTSVIAQ